MCDRFCQFLCALICPPIAVLCHSGCSSELCINVLLSSLCFIPGMIHAMCVVCSEGNREVRVTTNVNMQPPAVPAYQPRSV